MAPTHPRQHGHPPAVAAGERCDAVNAVSPEETRRHGAVWAGANPVAVSPGAAVISPNVLDVFPDGMAVNEALRALPEGMDPRRGTDAGSSNP